MWQLPELTTDEIVIYLRKSRADDPLLTVEEVLAKHEQMLDEWVERNLPGAGKIPEGNRYREVVSGETLDTRPAVQETLRRAESPRIKAILVVEPQRLSRGDLEDIGRIVKLLRYSDTLVLTIPYNYDLRDERDRDAFERELKRGNEFLEYQKKILNNGRLLSVQNGNYIGRLAPYGYKKITLKEGRRKCYTLEPIPEEAEAVRIMFDMYLQGFGCETIGSRLLELGYYPRDRKIWAGNTIRGILDNDHYTGKVRWNHKQTFRSVKDGEVVARRSIVEDYLLFPGKHPAIIDQETFDAVKKKRGMAPPNKKASNARNPLAGLMYCSEGHAMAMHIYRVRGEMKAADRYQCSKQKHCINASCLASELLAEVRKALAEALEDFEIRIEAGEDNSLEVQRNAVARLEKRLAELEALEATQWEKYTLEGMPKHIFEMLNKKVLEDKADVQEALCVAKGSIPEPINLEERITTFRAAIEMLDDPAAPVRELNMLLKECIERITYSRPKTTPPPGHTWMTGSPVELDIKLRI